MYTRQTSVSTNDTNDKRTLNSGRVSDTNHVVLNWFEELKQKVPLRRSEPRVDWAKRSRTSMPSPSMRRPVDVKAHVRFLFFLSVSLFAFSQAAPVAILPSALCCERSLLGASGVFSFQ